MDKVQSIIGFIILVLILVCAFLYFVFRPQKIKETEIVDENVAETTEYTFDAQPDRVETGVTATDDAPEVVAYNDIIRDIKQDDAPVASQKPRDTKKDVVAQKTADTVRPVKRNTPQTGAGEIALVVALVAAAMGSGAVLAANKTRA